MQLGVKWVGTGTTGGITSHSKAPTPKKNIVFGVRLSQIHLLFSKKNIHS